MPISKTKLKNAAIAAKSAALPKIPKELLDQFVSGPMTGEAVNAASMAFKKALIERALGMLCISRTRISLSDRTQAATM
jgi:putative transposase